MVRSQGVCNRKKVEKRCYKRIDVIIEKCAKFLKNNKTYARRKTNKHVNAYNKNNSADFRRGRLKKKKKLCGG